MLIVGKQTESQDKLLWLEGVKDKKGMPAGPGPEGYRFEHRIRINASSEAIWRVLSDVDRWREWSVLYPEASGKLKKGNVINITIFVPGTKKIPSTAVIEELATNRMVMFKSVTKLSEKLMYGMRYFTIEQINENHCIVIDGEVVGGVMGVLSARLMHKNLFNGLRFMNEGLKERVESEFKNR